MNRDEGGLSVFPAVEREVSKGELIHSFHCVQTAQCESFGVYTCVCICVLTVFVCVTPVHRCIHLIQTKVCSLEKNLLHQQFNWGHCAQTGGPGSH